MNYSDKTKKHLSAYKLKKFPGMADGIWKNNHKTYPHILPEVDRFQNLLPTYKGELIQYLGDKKIKLHSDFHHLNSSQVMCLNFFFPFYKENALEVIANSLGIKDELINYSTVCFEKDGLEAELGSNRPTSFDFYFETESGKKIFFEIKYTEGEFGKDSQKSLEKKKVKFEKYYSNSLKSLNDLYHNSETFSNDYQILRNLIHIDDNSYIVFIYPQNNEGIKLGAKKVKTDFLISSYHNHFLEIYWEDLIEFTSTSVKEENIQKQLIDFSEKYIY
jgi:hypothetical protein